MNKKMMVELFWASSCNRCQKAKLEIRNAIKQFDNDRLCYRELDVLEDLDYAVKVGVLKTPSIAFNGKLKFSSLPQLKHFTDAIEEALEETQ